MISSLSPLQYSAEMAGALIEYARHGQVNMIGLLMMAKYYKLPCRTICWRYTKNACRLMKSRISHPASRKSWNATYNREQVEEPGGSR
jgi:hypothetical protein